MKRKYKVTTTDSKHELPIYENILQREFNPIKKDSAWVQDITYICTKEGWPYLAVVIDLYSRKVIGYSMRDNMRKSLVTSALDMVLIARKAEPGLIVCSDRGRSVTVADSFFHSVHRN